MADESGPKSTGTSSQASAGGTPPERLNYAANEARENTRKIRIKGMVQGVKAKAQNITSKMLVMFRSLRLIYLLPLLVLLSVVIMFGLIYFFGGAIYSLIMSPIHALLGIDLVRWGLSIIFFIVGLFIVFKYKKHRGIGLILILLGGFIVWFYPSIRVLNSMGFFNFTFVMIIVYIILGFLFVSAIYKKSFGGAILVLIIGVLFYFGIGFITTGLYKEYTLKGEISWEESGLGKRIGRYWEYLKHPETFFAQYGEWTNPSAKEKRAPVGLEIKSFEPVISVFREDQNIRLSAEIKNYGLNPFRSDKENKINIGLFCELFTDETSSEVGEISISGNCGDIEENWWGAVIRDVPIDKNCTFFVFCDFKHISVKEEQETKKVTLTVYYNNFVTESVLKAYIMGKSKYDRINSLENRDIEFLYLLRNAASYPGLISNERRTIAEYSSGPVRLSVNILNSQPLTSDEEYNLIVNSKPNSIDWEGVVVPSDLAIVVPGWFSPQQKCAFEISGGGDTKRLKLKKEYKFALESCKETRGCTFFCDFTIEGIDDERNIEEYNIFGYQVSNYTIKKSTTVKIKNVKIGKRNVHGEKSEKSESEKKPNGGSRQGGSVNGLKIVSYNPEKDTIRLYKDGSIGFSVEVSSNAEIEWWVDSRKEDEVEGEKSSFIFNAGDYNVGNHGVKVVVRTDDEEKSKIWNVEVIEDKRYKNI